MCRCHRMDLNAEIRVATPSVKQTAPKISMASALPDLFALPSSNAYSPKVNRAADKMISKSVDILLRGDPERLVSLKTRLRTRNLNQILLVPRCIRTLSATVNTILNNYALSICSGLSPSAAKWLEFLFREVYPLGRRRSNDNETQLRNRVCGRYGFEQ